MDLNENQSIKKADAHMDLREKQNITEIAAHYHTFDELQVSSSTKDKNDKNKSAVFSKKDYVVIFVICLDTFCHGLGYLLMGSFFPLLVIKAKEMSMTSAGSIISALPLSTIISGAFISKFCDKVKREYILLSSFVFMVAGLLPFAFVMNIQNSTTFFVICFILRFIQGIGYIAEQLAVFSMTSTRYPMVLSTVFGFMEMSLGNGVGFGVAFGGYIYDSLGFKWPFIILSIISVFCFILTFFVIEPENKTNKSIETSEMSNNETKKSYDLSYSTAVRHPAILLQMASCCTLLMNITYFDVAMSPFLALKFGLSPSKIGLLFFIGVALYSVSCPLVGYINDKKSLHAWTIILGFLISFPAFILIGPTPIFSIQSKFWLTVTSAIFLYLSFAMIYVPIMGLIMIIIKEDTKIRDSDNTMNFVSAAFALSGNIGNFIGPFMGGILIQNLTFEWASAVYGLINLTMTLLCASYMISRKSGRKI